MSKINSILFGIFLGYFFILAKGHHEFHVGGEEGWVAHPSESFNYWAQRQRFHVYDRLVFEYEKDEDSVLVVSEQHYDDCYIYSPYLKLFGGKSIFDLGRPGLFFFISGNQTRCELGEKMITTVMAYRAPPPPSLPVSSPPAPPSPRLNSSRSHGMQPMSAPLSHHSHSSSNDISSFSRVFLVIVGLVLSGALLG